MSRSASNPVLTDKVIASLPGSAVILAHRKLRTFLQKGLREKKVQSNLLVELLESLNISEDEEAEIFGAVDALGMSLLDETGAPEQAPDDDKAMPTQNNEETVPLDDSLALFLHEVGSYDIPTKQDTITLCQKMEAGRMAQATLDAAKDEGIELDADQRKELQRTVRRGQNAKESLVNGNMRLVISIARKQIVNTSSMDLMDLIQEGAIGLMKAADKFDYQQLSVHQQG